MRGNALRSFFALGSFFAGDSGTISARTSPNRVTRTGFRVLRTCSRTAEHLTLNTEKSISFIEVYILTMRKKVSKVTKDQSRREGSYERAMRKALARKPFLESDGRYPSREEIYDRGRARRAGMENLGFASMHGLHDH